MIRLFVYLVIIASLGFGFSWIADHPGVVTLNWQGKDIRTSLMVVVVALVSVIAIILFTWGILRGVIGLPLVLSRFFSNRRRERGYQALSKGLIAAGTGDKALARRLTKESGKLLTNEPLVELLDAQTSLLEGNQQAARNRFQSMLDNDDTKLLALRGLYLEAEREGAREASRQYAEEASAISPSLAWAGNANLRNLSLDADWEGALKMLESNRAAGLVDKDTAKRHKAVLLTARAISEEPAHPDIAAKLATEAHRLAPDLVPAAVIGAAALVRGNKLRKASKMVEAVWKISPHPELAQSYVHMRMGDSVSDRLKRAQNLSKLRTNHPEGNFAIAQAAIDAKDWKRAREAMKTVLANFLTERACLIMADLEEGEHGDAGRMRDWLSRAVRAPRDAKWTADGYTSEIWLPISPVTGEIDVFEWKVPVEQLQAPTETIDIGDLAEPLKPLPVADHSEKTSATEDLNDQTIEIKSDKIVDGAAMAATAVAASDSVGQDAGAPEPRTERESETQITKDSVEEATIVELTPAEDKSAEGKSADSEPVAKEPEPEIKPADDQPQSVDNQVQGEIDSRTAVFPLPRRPDDPGVEEEKSDQDKGFKVY